MFVENRSHIRYNRNELLQLQYVPESLQRPPGLPALPDVILETVRWNGSSYFVSRVYQINLLTAYVRVAKFLNPKVSLISKQCYLSWN